ncbi:hypothetical protein FAIPA1_190053 [Frankia sp. AiPs1]
MTSCATAHACAMSCATADGSQRWTTVPSRSGRNRSSDLAAPSRRRSPVPAVPDRPPRSDRAPSPGGAPTPGSGLASGRRLVIVADPPAAALSVDSLQTGNR